MASVLDSNDCAKLFKAMADPTRLRILQDLLKKEKTVNELVKSLSLDQPKVSHHLAILRNAGLLQDSKEGRQVIYQLHPDVHHHLSKPDGTIDLGCCSVNLKK